MGDPRHLVLPLLLIVVMVALAYTRMGLLPAVVFLTAFGGGLVLYVATIWRTPFDVSKIMVPYLLTIVLFIAHVYEEYITGFEELVGRITGAGIAESDFLLIAAFIGPILWVSGAILMTLRTHFGNYFLCAFFVGMAIAELSHFVFPLLEDGTFHYASGMYTAALPLLPAGYGLYVMLSDVRRARRGSGTGGAR